MHNAGKGVRQHRENTQPTLFKARPLQERGLKIERTPRLLQSHTLDRMGIDHRCFDIAVAKQLLNRPDVIILLQKVTGKAMAKAMSGGAFGNLS